MGIKNCSNKTSATAVDKIVLVSRSAAERSAHFLKQIDLFLISPPGFHFQGHDFVQSGCENLGNLWKHLVFACGQ